MRKLSSTVVLMLALAGCVLVPTTSATRSPAYSPTLSVAWSLGAAPTSASTGSPYVINGCGYDASYGSVTVVVYTPASAAWTGEVPNANGCISISNFSTQGPGSYRIDAWQHLGKKDVIVASTSFTL